MLLGAEADIGPSERGLRGAKEVGPDRILVRSGDVRARPERLQPSVGHRDRSIAEGRISYARPDAPGVAGGILGFRHGILIRPRETGR